MTTDSAHGPTRTNSTHGPPRTNQGEILKPGRRRSTEAHAAIMEATIELLREVGYPRLTMEGVAARARVGKTTVYRWWPTKSSLVIEAINRSLDLPSVHSTGDWRADIRAVIQRMVDIFGRPPLGQTLPALAVDLARDPEAAEQLRLMLGPRRAANAAVLHSAVACGDLPQDLDVHALLDIVAGAVLYSTLIRGAPHPSLINQLTDFILDGRLPRLSGLPEH